MSNNGWSTINDVLNDFEELMGQRFDNIDSKFTVTGEAPPPFNLTEVEDEILKTNGIFATKNAKCLKPDLAGIRQMVRMVNCEYDKPTFDENKNIKILEQKQKTVVSISKLNPNVSEFVPQKVTNVSILNGTGSTLNTNGESSSSNVPTEESPNKPKGSHDEDLDIKETKKTEDAQHNDIDVNKRINVSNLNSEEINIMKEKLKLKIIDTSKADCPRKKRERNLAIASLLKLNTDVPKPPAEQKALKLITPEFYNTSEKEIKTKCSNGETKQNIHTVNEQVNLSANKLTTQTPGINSTQSVNLKLASEKCHSPTTSPHILSENVTSEPVVKKDCTNFHTSKEMLESVKKVNEWLKPEKPKLKSSVYLGPITFREKNTKSRSPNGENNKDSASDRPQRPQSTQNECFVPSPYAEELSKKYAENSKLRQTRSEDIWTKLERELKEKDKAIHESAKQ